MLRPAGFALRMQSMLLLALCTGLPLAQAADAPPPNERALWSRMMGQSGLRRFYSTGADLGELINRQVSYQVANRISTTNPVLNPRVATLDPGSTVEGAVVQYDSLIALDTSLPRPFYLRTLARSAKRFEPDKVHSRNDRYDLGMLYANSRSSYLGFGLGLEQTRADLKYVSGNTRLDAYGPRIDGGWQLRPWLALGARAEELRFTGDSAVAVRTPVATTTVSRELDYRRRYLQLESIVRLTSAQVSFLPAGWQAGGMAAVHYLDTRYRNQINSLGQPVVEPFGSRERLGVLRSGVFFSAAVGVNGAWNPYAELMFDHEFDTNLNHPFSAQNSVMLRTGLARILGPGKRLSVEYQRSQSSNGLRERDNLIFVAVMDF